MSIRLSFAAKISLRLQVAEVDGELVEVASGTFFSYTCEPVVCIENPDECDPYDSANSTDLATKFYEPGCCIGTNCTEANRCSRRCPNDPYPCRVTRSDCRSEACIECDKGPNGEDLYVPFAITYSANCLDYGKETVEETGEEYNWAIACGPRENEGPEERNMARGEYVCWAFKDGIDFAFNVTRSDSIPCQFIQMGECGCAPPDVYDFWLDPPNPDLGWTPCTTEDDCPWLCADAGEENAKNACHAFGGIDWWNGQNFVGHTAFVGGYDYNESNTKVRIYHDLDRNESSLLGDGKSSQDGQSSGESIVTGMMLCRWYGAMLVCALFLVGM